MGVATAALAWEGMVLGLVGAGCARMGRVESVCLTPGAPVVLGVMI